MEYLHLSVNGEDFEARPDNTHLFTYVGEIAMYNHCFLIQEEDGKEYRGGHVFQTLNADAYGLIAAQIKRYNYPQHLNMLEVAQCDIDAFNLHAYKDLAENDGLPEGW